LVLDKMGIRTRRESADLEEFFVRWSSIVILCMFWWSVYLRDHENSTRSSWSSTSSLVWSGPIVCSIMLAQLTMPSSGMTLKCWGTSHNRWSFVAMLTVAIS
jgi:hypothetical protein